MKSALRNGKLPVPGSLTAAKARHQQLIYEMGKIQKQLADPKRSERLGNENYDMWAKRASSALAYMEKEASGLALWIDRHPDSDLFREAWQLLRKLREEVDLDASELALLGRLDDYYEV